MVKLSVNINKIATLRNARGGNIPNVVQAAIDCQNFGADGITVHPRRDERHITKQDIYDIKRVINTEYNIEGYPSSEFIKMIIEIKPDQVTLVPDGDNVITSDSGWDTIEHNDFLIKVINQFKQHAIRTSIFVNPEERMIQAAKNIGTDCVELYTGDYALQFNKDKEEAISPYILASKKAEKLDVGVNAGHDLDLYNLEYFSNNIKNLKEVSIGHALISDSIYLGLENTIQMYKRLL